MEIAGHNLKGQEILKEIPYICLRPDYTSNYVCALPFRYQQGDFWQVAFETMSEDQTADGNKKFIFGDGGSGARSHVLQLRNSLNFASSQMSSDCNYSSITILTQTNDGIFHGTKNVASVLRFVYNSPTDYYLFTLPGLEMHSYTFMGKYYWVKIWQHGSLAADYRPCFKDGIWGIINEIDGSFIGNTFLTGGTRVVDMKKMEGPEI